MPGPAGPAIREQRPPSATAGAPGGRAASLDLVRALGLVAVVAGHVWGDGAVRTATYSWHVPVFFVVSGYLWRDGRRLGDEVVRRARSLLVPYVVWLLLVALGLDLLLPDRPAPGAFLARYGGAMLHGGLDLKRPWSAFWFITALLLATLAFRALQQVWAPVRWLVLAGGVLWCAAAPSAAAGLPLSAGLALPGAALIAHGRWLRTAERRLPRPAAVGAGALVAGAVLLVALPVRVVDLKAADLGTPVLGLAVAVLLCDGLVLVAGAAAPLVPAGLTRLATATVSASVAIVLGHALVLTWALQEGLGAPSVFAVSLLVPLGLGLLVRRSPLALPLLGR